MKVLGVRLAEGKVALCMIPKIHGMFLDTFKNHIWIEKSETTRKVVRCFSICAKDNEAWIGFPQASG